MQGSLWNNPVLGSGLASLVGQLVGNPNSEADALYKAAMAGNEMDTRDYRARMGEAHANKDLGSMLVAALQAGRDYSAEAPEIAASLGSLGEYGMGNREFGRLLAGTGVQNLPGSSLANMMGVAAGGGGGGGRGRPRGSGGGAAQPRSVALSAGGRTAALRALKNAGVPDEDAWAALAQAESLLGQGQTENSVLASLISGITQEEVVTDPREFTQSWNPLDAFRGPVTEQRAVLPDLFAPQVQEPLGGEKAAQVAGLPAVGAIIDGWEYLGGDPNDPASWRQVD